MYKLFIYIVFISFLFFNGCKKINTDVNPSVNDGYSDLESTAKKQIRLSDKQVLELNAEIANLSERYRVDTVHRFSILNYLINKYYYNPELKPFVGNILQDMAEKGDWYAINLNQFYSDDNSTDRLRKAAELGEPLSMSMYGALLISGRLGYKAFPMDEEKGFEYLKKAADMGDATALQLLVEFHYKYDSDDEFCLAAADMYKKYSFELFSPWIFTGGSVPSHIQRKCKTFGDNLVTEKRTVLGWLSDIDTDESKFIQAVYLSNFEPSKAKRMLEELDKKGSQRFATNAQLCLSLVYFHGAGGYIQENITLSDMYAKKAFDGGSLLISNMRESLAGIKKDQIMPPTIYIAEYNDAVGCFKTYREKKKYIK